MHGRYKSYVHNVFADLYLFVSILFIYIHNFYILPYLLVLYEMGSSTSKSLRKYSEAVSKAAQHGLKCRSIPQVTSSARLAESYKNEGDNKHQRR